MNDARPAAGARLCALGEIADPGSKGFVFPAADEGPPFRGFVVRRGETLVGYVDACPHTGASLAADDGRRLDRTGAWLVCFTHGAMFRIDDGLCVAGPCVKRRLRAWPVRLEGEDVVAGDAA